MPWTLSVEHAVPESTHATRRQTHIKTCTSAVSAMDAAKRHLEETFNACSDSEFAVMRDAPITITLRHFTKGGA